MNACKVLELITNGENEKLIELAKAEIKEQSIKEKRRQQCTKTV